MAYEAHHETRLRADLLPILLAAPVLGLCAWWSLDDGGYGATRWMIGAIVMAILLAISAWATGSRLAVPPRATRIAAAALAGYTAWSFASILWADAPGAALEGSQRTLLYLLTFLLFALLPWTPRALIAGVGAFVAVVTGVAVITLIRIAGAEDPSQLLIEARLAAPLGYQNATAALWTMAALPALGLAVRRASSWALRGASLAAAGLLVGLAVMTQSRGWLVALPVLVLIALATHPERWRWLAGAALVGAAVLAASGALLEPYAVGGGARPAGTAMDLRAALDDAAASLWGVVAGLLALGCALGLAERRMRTPSPASWLRRASRPAGAGLAAIVAIAGVVAVLAATDGRPWQRVESAWTSFSDIERAAGGEGASRFTALGSTRYDFWRVAVDEWRAHPAAGVGQDNFAQAYLAGRRSRLEEPRWTHSLWLRLLTHTGLVGALLFGAFLAAALWAANPWRSPAPDPSRRRVAAALALLPAAVWLVHGSVDWLWEFPALSIPALAFLAAAGVVRRDHAGAAEPARRGGRLVAAGAIALALLAIAVIVPSYIAARDVSWAATHWPAQRAAAYDRLERARALNPLGQRASLTEGIIAVRAGELDRAQRAFGLAARREPQDWFARFELGLLASARGDRGAARREFAAARARNPRDALVADALRRAGGRRPLTFAEADGAFAQRVERRLGR